MVQLTSAAQRCQQTLVPVPPPIMASVCDVSHNEQHDSSLCCVTHRVLCSILTCRCDEQHQSARLLCLPPKRCYSSAIAVSQYSASRHQSGCCRRACHLCSMQTRFSSQLASQSSWTMQWPLRPYKADLLAADSCLPLCRITSDIVLSLSHLASICICCSLARTLEEKKIKKKI